MFSVPSVVRFIRPNRRQKAAFRTTKPGKECEPTTKCTKCPEKKLTPDRIGTYGRKPVKRVRKKETLAPLALGVASAVPAGVRAGPERDAPNERNPWPARHLRRQPGILGEAKDASKKHPAPGRHAPGRFHTDPLRHIPAPRRTIRLRGNGRAKCLTGSVAAIRVNLGDLEGFFGQGPAGWNARTFAPGT